MQEELSKKLRLTDRNEVDYFQKSTEYDFSKFSSISFGKTHDLEPIDIEYAKSLNEVISIFSTKLGSFSKKPYKTPYL